MEKIKLDYNTVKGIFERMFFSSISGSSPLSAEVFHSFSILTIKQMLTMQDLAIRCKKYENAYNKSSSKFNWSLNHARSYRDLRDEFVRKLQDLNKNRDNTKTSSIFPHANDEKKVSSSEETAVSLQSDHINTLRNTNTKKKYCKWIHSGEIIEVKGKLLTRGLFYVGEYFKIPQSYRQISRFDIMNRKFRDYNRCYKLLKVYGPVLQKDLTISQGNLQIIPFSSYIDMHPTQRCEYLEWLAGEKIVSEIASETFLFYLYGLQMRMFIDESTTDQDRIDIIKNTIELYSQCQKYNIYSQELVRFIDAAISKYFTNKLVELVPKALLPHLRLYRDALIFNAFKENRDKSTEEIVNLISRSIVSILNYNNTIPESLMNDFFYRQYANSVWQDIIKRKTDVRNVTKDSRYEIYCMGLNNNYSKFYYDYIFSFILIPKSYAITFVYYSFVACFKEITKRLKDYILLYPVSPSLALFMLPPASISEYNEASSLRDFLSERTKDQEFTTIGVNEILRFGNTSQKNLPSISKTHFALIVKSLA